jgi:outer membrane receptor protein involved in Fe transport
VFPVQGLYATASVTRFDKYYANFDPANRTNANDRTQSWQIPAYNLVDLHAGYTLPGNVFGSGNLKFQFHVFNALDKTYISDADDGSKHDASTAVVFMGSPRRWNIALAYDY